MELWFVTLTARDGGRPVRLRADHVDSIKEVEGGSIVAMYSGALYHVIETSDQVVAALQDAELVKPSEW